ncbi:hypothetical protein IKG05_00670 [Candidatus Saccharibacteria bacterium]|nr:hypothetical protein [Candidatus Saccharibacteria bacterium]
MLRTEIPVELEKTMTKGYVLRALDDYADVITGRPLSLVVDGLWCALADAHDTCRSQPGFKLLINSENCANALNVGACLELAGPDVYDIWAKNACDILAKDSSGQFADLNLLLDKTFETSGFEEQLAWMEELGLGQKPLMQNIFVTNRRRFVEDAMISGKGSLFEYMLKQYPRDDPNFLFRQARQIILANGGVAPIEW